MENKKELRMTMKQNDGVEKTKSSPKQSTQQKNDEPKRNHLLVAQLLQHQWNTFKSEADPFKIISSPKKEP